MTNKIRRALISVSDKTGLVDFARALHDAGVALLSTGGTSKALQAAGIPVRDVSEETGFPEIMDGRVKTLHPKIHGGLLAIEGAHGEAMSAHGIAPIDLLVVNLYPFEETAAKGGAWDDCVENIDIGGPAMIRAAAKNHERVTVVVDASDYEIVISEIGTDGGPIPSTRRAFAAKAFARTAAYDAAISKWFEQRLAIPDPGYTAFGGKLVQTLRYGENPHQTAALYATGEARPGVVTARRVQGRELSYNNINDTDAALECVAEFSSAGAPACVIVKHANPCGVATAATPKESYLRALACDPASAFGGIIALNHALDADTAREIVEIFTEVIVAPGASEEALAIIAAKKNLRLLLTGAMPDPRASGMMVKSVAGGLLVQSRDAGVIDDLELEVVTKRAPSDAELADLRFAFRVAKHVKSNAIVYAKDGATVGIGAGQMSRVDSSRIAAQKGGDAVKGSVVASDAFFPFADGLIEAASAGATAVIQPGGSIKDGEVIKAADEAGLAMVFTGMRHFRH
jgi:phosphoribosylaminoimidazolecarboxamide formyltransferase / IMP cyclohydrolase